MTFLKFESNLALELQTKILKLLEQVWEALPQLALAITYYINNYYYVWFSETFLPIPTIRYFIPMKKENSTCEIASAALGTLFLCCVRV